MSDVNTIDKGIRIRNIFCMMAYALLDKDWGYENISSEDFENVRNLLASLIIRILDRRVKQGLYRQYREYQEDTSSPRGRIDIWGSIQLRVQHQRKLRVHPEDLSENNLANQIIKATMKELLRDHNDRYELKGEYRNDLKRLLRYFITVDAISLSNIPWKKIQIDRNYQDYYALLRLCRYALESRILSDNAEEYRLPHFTAKDENELFEKFILNYYAIEHDLHAKVTEMDWPRDDGKTILAEKHEPHLLPVMRTDITLSKEINGQMRCLIIDAKYYTRIMVDPVYAKKDKSILKKGKFRSANLYQIFTYVKTMEARLKIDYTNPKVAGLLMYAKTDEEVEPYSWSIDGNEIGIMALDLSKRFVEIRKTLDDLVYRYFK